MVQSKNATSLLMQIKKTNFVTELKNISVKSFFFWTINYSAVISKTLKKYYRECQIFFVCSVAVHTECTIIRIERIEIVIVGLLYT